MPNMSALLTGGSMEHHHWARPAHSRAGPVGGCCLEPQVLLRHLRVFDVELSV